VDGAVPPALPALDPEAPVRVREGRPAVEVSEPVRVGDRAVGTAVVQAVAPAVAREAPAGVRAGAGVRASVVAARINGVPGAGVATSRSSNRPS